MTTTPTTPPKRGRPRKPGQHKVRKTLYLSPECLDHLAALGRRWSVVGEPVADSHVIDELIRRAWKEETPTT